MESTSVSSFQEPALSSWSDVLLVIGMGLLSVVTVFGNSVVVLSYYLDKNIRQPSNYFIFSLAVSDLLIGLEGIPVYTHFFIHNQQWKFGWFLCDLWLSIDYSCCLASIYTVLGITVDRYCSVKYPAAYRNWRTPTRVLVIIALTWIIPSVLFSVSIFGYGWITGHGRLLRDDQCEVQFMSNGYLNMGMYISYYWSTLIVMLVLYYGIYRAAKQLASKSEQKNKRLAMLSRMANRGNAIQPPLSSVPSRDPVSAVLTSEAAPSSSVADDTSDSLHSRSNMLTPTAGSSSHKISRVEGTVGTESSGGVGSEPESVAFHVVDDLPFIDDEDEHVAIHRRLGTIRNSQKQAHLKAMNNAAAHQQNNNNHTHHNHNHVIVQSPKRNGLDDCEQVRVPLLTVSKVERHRPDDESNVRRILTVMRSRSGRRRKRKTNEYRASKSENRARKALRTITVILGTFVVLWTPFYVLATIYGFCERCKKSEGFNLLYSISYYLCYMNSPLNPLCYAFANANFKKTFKRILRGDLHKT